MIQAVAMVIIDHTIHYLNAEDIKAIYNVVSGDLQEQIRKAYPELFGPEQFDFTKHFNDITEMDLPFYVGNGLCDREEDKMKCLIVSDEYLLHLHLMRDLLCLGQYLFHFDLHLLQYKEQKYKAMNWFLLK